MKSHIHFSNYRPYISWVHDSDEHSIFALRKQPNPLDMLFSKPSLFENKKIILCFGGSTTYGWLCADTCSYPVFLQELLGPTHAVFNVGVTGSCITQSLYLLVDILRYLDQPFTCIFLDGINEKQGFLQYKDNANSFYIEQLNYSRLLCARMSRSFYPIRHLICRIKQYFSYASNHASPELHYYVQKQAETYIRTQNTIQRLVNNQPITCHYFLQPVQFFSEDPLTLSQPSVERKNYLLELYGLITSSCPETVDLSTSTSLCDQLEYLDWQHLSPNGNKTLAQAIYSSIA